MSTFAEKTKKPNLIFIITDQQRFDAMSCAGNATVQTPNMDRLAKEGVMFKNAYVANPVCVPSRAVFLTGLSPVNVHVEGNGDYTSEDVPDVPTFDFVLKDNGYTAEYYGKWHTPHQFTKCYNNDVKVVGNIKGAKSNIAAYQEWLQSKGVEDKKPDDGQLYSTRNKRPYTPIELDWNHDHKHDEMPVKMKLKSRQVSQYGKIDLPAKVSYAAFTAEETLEAIERLKDKPFSITCSFDPPHPPMIVQEPYYSMYDPAKILDPETIDDPMTHSPYRKKSKQGDQLHYRDKENIKHMRSIYYGMVKEVDDWIGEILKKLDENGLTENTMVIFTSDHGEMLGDHGMHSKVIFYEGSVHVPLLIRYPAKIKAGQVVNIPVSSMDVFPTILDYFNYDIPKNDGLSLRPLVEGKNDDHAVISYSLGRDQPNYMIRYKNLKLMVGKDKKYKGIAGMYDLSADPSESRNLIFDPVDEKKNKEQAKMMKQRLVGWLKEHEPNRADGVEQRDLYASWPSEL